MTAPTPTPGASPTAPVPLNPDGTPKLGSTSGGVPVGTSAYSLWSIPQQLYDYLSQVSGGTLWFDTGRQRKRTVRVGAEPDQNTPVPVRTENYYDSSYRVQATPEKVMQQIAAMSKYNPLEYLAVQKALASGPWGKVYMNGAWDHSTQAALGNAMLMYVQLSMGTGTAQSFKDYLITTGERAQQLGGAGTSLGGGGSSIPPVSLTDPAQIRQAAQSAAMSALGHGLSDSELNKFVSQFQAAQTSSHDQAYSTGSTSFTQPDLSSQAESFAQTADPNGFKQNQHQTYLDALVNMFAPSGSQRPDMGQPTPSIK